jgi:hypothetical protein
MGIRFSHIHDDTHRACYTVRSNHPLTERKIFRVANTGKEYAIAYMPWTGHYYVYDTATGEELASIRREFIGVLLDLIPSWSIGEMQPAPDCNA